jgi:hypothetical protein
VWVDNGTGKFVLGDRGDPEKIDLMMPLITATR